MELLYWTCLGEKCKTNCCGDKFINSEVINLHGLCHDTVPLLPEEKCAIVERYGPEYVKRDRDGVFYLNVSKGQACPFLADGKCTIQENKPIFCRSYPLVRLDSFVGAVFDESCPGFAYAKKHGIEMNKWQYVEMLRNFIMLQEYRLSRVRIELESMSRALVECQEECL